MSEIPPKGGDTLIWLYATVTYGALVFASWGFTSLLLGVDVVSETDADPILGPSMLVAATIVVFGAVWGIGRRRSPALPAIAATIAVYMAMLGVGAVGYAITRADAIWVLLFVGNYALSIFVLLPAVLAGGTVTAVWAMTRARSSGASNGRYP